MVNEVCPHCNVPLVEKNGKFGAFWGCPNYPKCNYIYKSPKNVAPQGSNNNHGYQKPAVDDRNNLIIRQVAVKVAAELVVAGIIEKDKFFDNAKAIAEWIVE